MEGATREIRQDGHILPYSTRRKDKYSKIYTSKGPKDRRVRLSAHTAIQFYDVQDRLGFDRSTKAVDWLINKAKNAIDKLNDNELPSNWQLHDADVAHAMADNSNPSSKTPYSDMNNMKSFFPTGFNEGLGLSLFQGSFQRKDGWNSNRDGFVQEISQQGISYSHQELLFPHRELLQSNLASTGQHFEFGFGIHGEEQPETDQ